MLHPKPPKDYVANMEVASCIIESEWEILLVQRSADRTFPKKWTEPGGKIEARESSNDAMMREVLEETGIHINPQDTKLLFKKYLSFWAMNLTIDFYFCSFKSKPEVSINHEHLAYKWVSPSAALEMDLIEDLHLVIKEIYKNS